MFTESNCIFVVNVDILHRIRSQNLLLKLPSGLELTTTYVHPMGGHNEVFLLASGMP